MKLLLEAAAEDCQFDERLHQIKLQAQGAPPDLSRYREMIAQACYTERFVEYKYVPEFARRIQNSLRPIRQMLKDGQAAKTIDLIDFAIEHVGRAFVNCHDDLQDVSSTIEWLSEQHLVACRLAKLDPVQVARTIFKREWKDDHGFFSGLLEKYTEVLTPEGVKVYESELRSSWRRLPVVKDPHGEDGGRLNLERMAEAFSRVTGRPELLDEVKSTFAGKQKREIPSVEQRIHELILSGKQRDYGVAVNLLKQVSAILKQNGTEGEWEALLQRVQTKHSRKSIFMRALRESSILKSF